MKLIIGVPIVRHLEKYINPKLSVLENKHQSTVCCKKVVKNLLTPWSRPSVLSYTPPCLKKKKKRLKHNTPPTTLKIIYLFLWGLLDKKWGEIISTTHQKPRGKKSQKWGLNQLSNHKQFHNADDKQDVEL